jgi:hypothetical protein
MLVQLDKSSKTQECDFQNATYSIWHHNRPIFLIGKAPEQQLSCLLTVMQLLHRSLSEIVMQDTRLHPTGEAARHRRRESTLHTMPIDGALEPHGTQPFREQLVSTRYFLFLLVLIARLFVCLLVSLSITSKHPHTTSALGSTIQPRWNILLPLVFGCEHWDIIICFQTKAPLATLQEFSACMMDLGALTLVNGGCFASDTSTFRLLPGSSALLLLVS